MQQSHLSLASLFAGIWGRRWAIFFIAGISAGAAAVISILTAPTYSSTATLVIDFDKAVGSQINSNSTLSPGLQENYLTTQMGILSSRHVATKVVDNLGLESDAAWQSAVAENTDGRGSARNWIAGQLLESLVVAPGKKSRLVNITYTAQEPETAATLANAFAKAYEETNLEMNTQPARKEARQFELTLKELRENLVQTQRKLGSYQRDNGILLTDERMDLETERLKELLEQRIQSEADARALTGKLRRIKELRASGASLDTLREVLDNDVIRDLKRQLATKETEFADIRRQLGKNHPKYKSISAEAGTLRARINREVESIADSIRDEVEQAAIRAEEYARAEQQQESDVMELKQRRDQLSALVREKENAQQNYDYGLQRYNQFMVQSRLSQTNVLLLNPALVPSQAAGPKLKHNIALGGILGLLLGLAYAMIRERLDRRVRSRDELEEISGDLFLGSVPHHPA